MVGGNIIEDLSVSNGIKSINILKDATTEYMVFRALME